MQTSPIVLTTIAGLSTGLGGALAVLCTPTERLLAASAGFAGGVMLTASLTDLLPEALDFYAAYLPPLGSGGAAVSLLALGMLTAALLGRLLPEESELADRHSTADPTRAAAMRTALITGAALLLHNFPEGVLTFFAGTADPAPALRRPLHCTTSRRALPWRCPLPTRPAAAQPVCWRRLSPGWRNPWERCWPGCSCAGFLHPAF